MIQIGLQILKEKSKDIRVLSFLSYAYLRKASWNFFADVFEGLAALSQQNFAELHPKRERTRIGAFKWLSEQKYTDALEQIKPTEKDYEHILRLVAALEKLQPLLAQNFPQENPFPAALLKAAKAWETSCKPKPKEAVSQSATSAAGVSSTIQEPLNTPKDAQLIGRKIARFLIEKEPTKSLGYRLSRSLRWDIMEKAPPLVEGKTQLSGPTAEQRTYFQKLVADKDWKTALEKAELAFNNAANHLWFDLQRIAAEACKHLGAQYSAVREGILIETAWLIRRIPELPNYLFSDGTPFCDETTKQWLNTEVKSFAAQSATTVSQTDKEDPIEKQRQKASEFVSAGKIEEALDFLQDEMTKSASEEDNFKRALLIGSILLNVKKYDVAVSILENLEEKISQYHLERWAPPLAVETWEMLIKAYKAAKTNKPPNVQAAMSEKQNEVLKKISQINPKKAFSLT